ERVGGRQRSDDDRRTARDIAIRPRDDAAGSPVRRARFRYDVVADDAEACFHQVRRHRRAHDAKPDHAHRVLHAVRPPRLTAGLPAPAIFGILARKVKERAKGWTMPAYWVARSKVNDPVEYKKYT